jgi:hypothetical protein
MFDVFWGSVFFWRLFYLFGGSWPITAPEDAPAPEEKAGIESWSRKLEKKSIPGIFWLDPRNPGVFLLNSPYPPCPAPPKNERPFFLAFSRERARGQDVFLGKRSVLKGPSLRKR